MDHRGRAPADELRGRTARHHGAPDRSREFPEVLLVRCARRGRGDLAARSRRYHAGASPAGGRVDRQELRQRTVAASDRCQRRPADRPDREQPDRWRRAAGRRGPAGAFSNSDHRDQHDRHGAGGLARADQAHGDRRDGLGHDHRAHSLADHPPDQPAEPGDASADRIGAAAARHGPEQHVAGADPVRRRRIHRHLQPPLCRHVRPVQRRDQARLPHPRGDASPQGARGVHRRRQGVLRRRHEGRRRRHGLHKAARAAQRPRVPGHQHAARAGRMGRHDRRDHRTAQPGAGARPQLHFPPRDHRPYPLADHGEGRPHAAISADQPDRRGAIRPIERSRRWQDRLRYIPG